MPDVAERIEAFNQGRNAERLNIKYGMMRETRFAFMRGTCHLYYEDWPKQSTLNSTPAAWIAGDLHPLNFALYQGDDGQTYLDINDFDESILAPYAWDVARFLTSIQIAFVDFSTAQRQQIAQRYLDAYVAALAADQIRSVQAASAPADLRRWMLKHSGHKREKLLNSYTVRGKKRRKFKTIQDKTFPLNEAERKRAIGLLDKWSKSRDDAKRYQVIDVSGRIAGISSIGLERYVLLVEGGGSSDSNWLIELKQRIDSALVPYVAIKQPDWANAAARVVMLQQRLQAVPPAPLEAIIKGAVSFTVREIQPVQEKIAIEQFHGLADLQESIEVLGKLTAWAHLRGCGRQGAAPADDLIALAGQSGWQTDVLKYALDYAKQIVADYKVFSQSALRKTD